MTNRLSKWSRHSSRMVCLLAACGLMYACKDEFILDDEKPSFLNSSVYESLESQGHFRTYLRLLADKDVNPEGVRPLTDVLSRTGSKTVFVATDSAWNKFFESNAKLPESNPWHNATSYENLSPSQKKLLIHTSMLNNAIVMENLASSESTGNTSPVRGEYMRRYTDIMWTDTISYVPSSELPKIYSTTDKDYWARFREENGGNGIRLVTDDNVSMMLHFTSEHMTKSSVTDGDFAIFMGRPRVTSDVHVYDAKLLQKDLVCENGYVNVTEKPLCPLASMAEVIRVNGMTDIFSHMIDRYCAPFYSYELSYAYSILDPTFDRTKDSIFVKRYFSDLSNHHLKLDVEPADKGTVKVYNPYLDDKTADKPAFLKFDPAWNGYYDEVDVRKDMAAMFVPCDESLWDYFLDGGGKQLLTTYAKKEGTSDEVIGYQFPNRGDYEELYKQIDCIPLGTLDALINIIMCRSFTGSVPSKMTKLRDDAQEQLFYPSDVDKIDTCLLASNGAVYIMKDVYGPADYTSVTSPAYISETNRIMKWAIYDQTTMGLNYYAYLKAMQSKFTYLLPSDKGMAYYYDPTSMKSRTPRVIALDYKTATFPITARSYNYFCPYNKDKGEVGTIGNALQGSVATISQSDITNRLKDILESHTIVHDGTNPMTLQDREEYAQTDPSMASQPLNSYFLTKNGNAVKVLRVRDVQEVDPTAYPGENPDSVVLFQGGFQLENERLGIVSNTPGVTDCAIEKAFEKQKNGHTYVLGSPLVPTYRSVYSILTDDDDQNHWKEEDWAVNPYREFYNLCSADAYQLEIKGCGLVDERLTPSEQKSALKKFNIFVTDNGLDYNVQFFNNYRYTLFVPTNEAIESAIANGLPTWEEIAEDFHSHCKPAKVEHAIVDADNNPVLDEDGNPTYEWVIKYDENDEIVYTDSLLTTEDSVRIAAKITYLTNFVRYHFADNSVFVDRSELKDNEMVTSSYDKELGLFCKLHVDRVDNGGKNATLRVSDDVEWKANPNNKIEVLAADPKYDYNILARDIHCNKTPINVAMTNISLDASSAAVIHRINGILNHTALKGGRHDSTWATPSEAKRYLKRYAIQ